MNRSLAVLSVLAFGCATPSRAPVPPAPVPPASAPACDDLERFRDDALARPGWSSPPHAPVLRAWRPGAPVAPEQREAVVELARAWVRECAVGETIELTRKLVAFPTVRAEQSAADGPAFVGMGRVLEDWSKQRGFEFLNPNRNEVWEIRSGPGDAVLSFVTHGDVVPVREEGATGPLPEIPPGWTHPPYKAELVDGHLYGRGTEDDKGPLAASLVVMNALKRFGLETDRGAIIAVVGNGEEYDWEGMQQYVATTKKPTHVVSLDANFPVVAAESGFVAWELEVADGGRPARAGRCTPALEVRAGQFLTQVPGDAVLVVRPAPGESLAELLGRAERAALSAVHPGVRAISVDAGGERRTREVVSETGAELPFAVAFEVGDGVLTIRVLGEAVHSSVAEQGHNAMWALAELGSELGLCDGAIATTLRLVRDELAGDLWGERLGLAYAHPFMGKLLVVPTLLRTDAAKNVVRLGVNMRRPEGRSNADFAARLDQTLGRLQAKYGPTLAENRAERHIGDPAMADLNGALVPRLLELYAKHSGDPDPRPISIRGGTYARLFPGAVTFGPAIPGRPYRGHAPDEFIELDALRLLTRAIFDLALDPPR